MSDAPVAQSALHLLYLGCGTEMALRDGWSVPVRFGPVDAEVEAARAAVAVGELPGGGVLDVVGGGLGELAARLGAASVPVGAAMVVEPGAEWAPPPNTRGAGVGGRGWGPDLHPGIGYPPMRWLRLTREHARLVLARPDVPEVRASLEAVGGCVHATDVSSGLMTLVVVGPRSPDLLARLVRLDLDPRVFADRAVALTGAAGIPLQVLRWDRGPLLAFELTVGRDVAEYFWETLTHAGHGLGLQPVGTEALSRLTND